METIKNNLNADLSKMVEKLLEMLRQDQRRQQGFESSLKINIKGDLSGNLAGRDVHQTINNYNQPSNSGTDDDLSIYAQELLLAAVQYGGQIILIDTQQTTDEFVRIGGRNFPNEHNNELISCYRAGLDELIEQGYVVKKKGILYKLTKYGQIKGGGFRDQVT